MTPLHPLGVSRGLVVCVRGLRSAFGRGSENLGALGSGNPTDRGLRFGLFRFGLFCSTFRSRFTRGVEVEVEVELEVEVGVEVMVRPCFRGFEACWKFGLLWVFGPTFCFRAVVSW